MIVPRPHRLAVWHRTHVGVTNVPSPEGRPVEVANPDEVVPSYCAPYRSRSIDPSLIPQAIGTRELVVCLVALGSDVRQNDYVEIRQGPTPDPVVAYMVGRYEVMSVRPNILHVRIILARLQH